MGGGGSAAVSAREAGRGQLRGCREGWQMWVRGGEGKGGVDSDLQEADR